MAKGWNILRVVWRSEREVDMMLFAACDLSPDTKVCDLGIRTWKDPHPKQTHQRKTARDPKIHPATPDFHRATEPQPKIHPATPEIH